MAFLQIDKLTCFYGKALALDGVSLRVEQDELVAVLGPNGAGKTTLLKAISRIIPSSGSIQFDGQQVQGLPAERVVSLGICHCPEGRRLFGESTVLQNLKLGAFLQTNKEQIHADLDAVFEMFPVLKSRSSQRSSTLSGGEQQMLAIGRALMGRPKLLILDEPSSGIAHRLKKAIFEAIAQIRRSGTAVLLVEQDAKFAFSVASRLYLMEHGQITKEGSVEHFSNSDEIRKAYLGI